jgi:hypothetical protein
MSVCICSNCGEYEDTDFYNGLWRDNGDYLCEECRDRLEDVGNWMDNNG